MCYKVECKRCGKSGWGGCGKHVVPLYNGIQKGSHCMCRSWPGVVLPPASSTPSLPVPAAAATATAGSAVGGNVKK